MEQKTMVDKFAAYLEGVIRWNKEWIIANEEDEGQIRLLEQVLVKYQQFKPTPNIEQALINLESYFEDKADADYEFNDIDGRYIPNEEMGLLNDVLVIKKYFGIE